MSISLPVDYRELVRCLAGLPREDLIELITDVEESVGECDLLVPLYKHFKKLVTAESPEDL